MPFTEKDFTLKEIAERLKRLEATTIQQHLCCDRVATLLDVTPRWVQQRVTAGEFVGSRTN